jgi:PKD repeat protein
MRNTLTFATKLFLIIIAFIPLSLFAQKGVTNDTIWIHYDDVENYDSWGFLISGELYDVMSKWDSDDLSEYEGWMITQIKFIVTSSLPFISVKVWEGPDATEIYSQEVPSYNVNTWTTVELDSAIYFDHTKDLYFGYEVDMTHTELGGIVTATDDGPAVDGYGNLVRKNNVWLSEYNNHNLRAMICEPIISDFVADKTTVCDSSTVSFTNLSSEAESYSWVFQGGTPFTSNLENPIITYNTPGTYDVKLTITHGGQSVTEMKEDYINVLEIPSPIEGEDLVCAWTDEQYSVLYHLGSSYTWDVINGEIIDGQGTNQIMVSWHDAGTGFVSVLEESGDECQGQSGLFEVTIDVCSAIDEHAQKSDLIIYPNPVQNEEITIKKLGDEHIPIAIFDLSGRMVFEEHLISNESTLNIGELPKGIYILKAIFSDSIETLKIVVE